VIRVGLIKTGGTLDPTNEIVRPDGRPLCPATPADVRFYTLDRECTHTILVRDLQRTGTGDCQIAIERLTATATPALRDLLAGTSPSCGYWSVVSC
jgi:hypothetical protein